MALLDGLTTTVKAAHGLFLMKTGYAGAAIRVKDGLGTQADIGFDGSGNLDTAALSGHAPYKIVKWYDQSGGGNDGTNNTGSDEGTLSTLETAVHFDQSSGTAQYLTLPDLSALPAGEAFVYMKLDADPPANVTGVDGGLWKIGTSGDNSHIPLSDGNIYDGFGSTVRKNSIAHTGSMASYHIYSAYSAAGDWANYKNGTQLFATASNTTGFSSTPTIGRSKDINCGITGHMRAFVLFEAKVTAGERTTFSNVASYVPPPPPPPPTITITSPLSSVIVGSAFTGSFATSGGSGTKVWTHGTGLPPGLSISSSGVRSGTATIGGTYTFDVTVTDDAGTDTKSFIITIINHPSITETDPLSGVAAGVSSTHTLHATGMLGTPTWLKTSSSPGVSINGSTGIVSDTDLTVGARTITAIVTDSIAGASSPVTLTWNVVAPPTPPTGLTLTELSHTSIRAALGDGGGGGGDTEIIEDGGFLG